MSKNGQVWLDHLQILKILQVPLAKLQTKKNSMELKKYRLSDIAQIEISGVDKKTIEGETPVRLCNFVDVYYNWAITKEKAKSFMAASAKQTEIDKCSIGKGMVAITKDSETRDDIGVATYIADDFEDVLLGYHCALITPNPAVVDGKYLNAFMHTRYIQKYFENNASGSGQRYTLSNDTISNIPVLLPSIEEQHIIGKLLADLDRKIELNKQINDNLEEMAKQLYDSWFVQFDFPHEEGKPYKSSGGAIVWKEKLKREIPQGWSISNVKSLIEPIERGVSYSSDDLLDPFATPMINLACFSKAGDYRLGEMKFFSGKVSNDKLISPMDMLIACTDMTQGADIIGRPILASDEYDQYTFSTDLALITPKGKFKMYLYYTLRTPFYHKYIRPFASGTTVKHLNLIGVENYGLPVPPIEIQSKFEDLITPIKEKQSKNLNEINALTKQRDELLPLLMNGQATINYHLSDD